ncbi:Oxysterol-binding protein-like protein 1 [Smittium culicis]|uniref:Oxysterol-binding protein-like protein 1 n=1 Tax=Smittium culicis TaxID=133412 RepID=A0A1R1YNL8_9FUNG|nr:Oxysterol-binding protein-like protein 1 [Smittium culicis]
MFKSKKANKSEVSSDKSDPIELTSQNTATTEVVSINNDQSKVMGMLGILRKLIGVKDLINLRLSLPTQLLDPISNLEFWGYMDQPDFFIRIPDNDDPVERLIDVIRWWVVKDYKYSNGRIVKPFNSVLGEQFFCKWKVAGQGKTQTSSKQLSDTPNSKLPSQVPSISDDSSPKQSSQVPSISDDSSPKQPSQVPSISDDRSSLDNSNSQSSEDDIYVDYITEQVSHHPPVSAYIYRCPQKQIEASGLDHISAKFSGLSATIKSGSWTKGIFLTLGSRDNEEYLCTHADANVVGWLTNSLKLVVTGSIRISCPKNKIAAILDFSEKNWYGKISDVIDGRIFNYNPETDDISTWTSKTIPQANKIIATISGQWNGESFVSYTNKPKPVLLLDMSSASIAPKYVKPLEEQSEYESRMVWGSIAELMIKKDYSSATKKKIEVEEYQRKLASERKEKGEPFVPRLFVNDFEDGKPKLLENAVINI